MLSLSILISCGGKEERPINLDLLICESPKDNKLTEQQVQILLPFEKDSIRYVAEGSILNTKDTIVYTKEKSLFDKLATVQKPLFSVQELVGNHLRGLNLSPLLLENSLSKNDVNKYSSNYEFILGFSTKQPKNLSTYSFKIYTKIEEVLSYIKEVVLVNDPDARILLIYNPPIDSTSVSPVPPPPISIKEKNKKVENLNTISNKNNVHEIKDIKGGNVSNTQTSVSTSVPTLGQLNDLLNRISNSDDNARDKLTKVLGNNLRVEGISNISNVQQLIIDVSNGSHCRISNINTNSDGKVVSISVVK